MKYLKKEFKKLKPYHSAHISDGIILNANESPLNIPLEIKEEFKKVIDGLDFNRYPDTDNRKLLKAIADNYALEEENVCAGVGSDEMLDCIFKSVTSIGDFVLVPHPSFTMYKQMGFYYGTKVIEVKLDNEFKYNVDEFIKNIKKYNPKLIFLCVPNNPTGTIMSNQEVERILKASNGLVVVDEAYAEFCDISAISLINKYENLMVLRTFSKAYRLAGIRTGYALSSKENIDMLNVVKMPYNLNVLSNEMAILAIRNKELFLSNLSATKNELKRTSKALKDLGIKVYESHANFIWCELSEKVKQALADKNIYIRNIMYEDVQYSRISIGKAEEMEEFIKVVRENANS